VELPQGLAGGDCRLLFERDPLPKPRTLFKKLMPCFVFLKNNYIVF